MKKHYKRVLTIAGSDPSGGAGIQADLKTFSACGCYGMSAIVAVVDENTVGVTGVHPVPVDFVTGQIRSVLDDIGADAVKIGMLHSSELIRAVRETLAAYDIRNIVLDPVIDVYKRQERRPTPSKTSNGGQGRAPTTSVSGRSASRRPNAT